MTIVLRKLISGGQTGADFGALVAARELGIETGGAAPKGWLTERGPQEALLRRLGLSECEADGYPARTRRNVADSDGTLLIGQLQTGGSRLTYEVATELKKPLFLLACPNPPDATSNAVRGEEFRYWLRRQGIETLNVA